MFKNTKIKEEKEESLLQISQLLRILAPEGPWVTSTPTNTYSQAGPLVKSNGKHSLHPCPKM